ncbi:MAG TPA: LD-carboxypeptidase [Cyanothece sp. UBA12306]|nr:LD-carboxypeptidase [Cyanothece sp. UBA12306]
MKINRRQLLSYSLTSLSLVAFLSNSSLAGNSTIIKPQRLKPGSGVGLFSPAGATFVTEQIDIVKDAVKALGLVPYFAPNLLERYGYLAGKDQDRAADVNQLFADPKIDLLLPITGGWGCARILPYLDYKLIQNNPKIIVGFSDLTALILAIYGKTGLVTFHGPNGLTSWRTGQVESFRSVLFAGKKIVFQNQLDGDDSNRLMQVQNRIKTINSGQAKGRFIGGNLSVISGLVGSAYLPNFEGAILFLEDVGEAIYRIDRLLTHLKLAGILDKLSGFIFGQCTRCLPNSDYGSLTLEEVIEDHIKPLGIPSWFGAQIGHIENMATFPLGVNVEIDANLGTISFLESGVN